MLSGRSISLRFARVLRPVTKTWAPNAPSSTAIARPHPLAAPVTQDATLSLSEIDGRATVPVDVLDGRLRGKVAERLGMLYGRGAAG